MLIRIANFMMARVRPSVDLGSKTLSSAGHGLIEGLESPTCSFPEGPARCITLSLSPLPLHDETGPIP
jgi:hypothetical protein